MRAIAQLHISKYTGWSSYAILPAGLLALFLGTKAMASLAERSQLIGFFSYSRNDDEGDDGAITALANRVYRELRAQLGRNAENFKLWRDKDALAAGVNWKDKLNEAVSESVFFITMVSPSALNSPFCRYEFESFLERERE